MASKCNEILRQVQTVIIGKDEILAKVLMAILSGGHILLEDVPGVGKTTLALAFAKTLGIHSKRMQFTSDSMPSDVIGFSVYDKAGGALAYKPGAAMTNLLLADEINRTILKRFNGEGLEFAFPTSTTYLAYDSKREVELKVKELPQSPAAEAGEKKD